MARDIGLVEADFQDCIRDLADALEEHGNQTILWASDIRKLTDLVNTGPKTAEYEYNKMSESLMSGSHERQLAQMRVSELSSRYHRLLTEWLTLRFPGIFKGFPF